MKQSNILVKTDTSENWAKCEDKYIPMEHILIAYADPGEPPRYKISDGKSLLCDLPFISFSEERTPSVEDEVLSY